MFLVFLYVGFEQANVNWVVAGVSAVENLTNELLYSKVSEVSFFLFDLIYRKTGHCNLKIVF